MRIQGKQTVEPATDSSELQRSDKQKMISTILFLVLKIGTDKESEWMMWGKEKSTDRADNLLGWIVVTRRGTKSLLKRWFEDLTKGVQELDWQLTRLRGHQKSQGGTMTLVP
jgi:hypothetical protein